MCRQCDFVGFVVLVLMTNHIWLGFGSMQVNSPCWDQKKQNTLADMQSSNTSAIIWRLFGFIVALFIYLHSYVHICW